MGKVYLKTKFDNEMKMEIPHSVNIANAMYGFRELGAEIIPYHKIDEIYDRVTRKLAFLMYSFLFILKIIKTAFNREYI